MESVQCSESASSFYYDYSIDIWSRSMTSTRISSNAECRLLGWHGRPNVNGLWIVNGTHIHNFCDIWELYAATQTMKNTSKKREETHQRKPNDSIIVAKAPLRSDGLCMQSIEYQRYSLCDPQSPHLFIFGVHRFARNRIALTDASKKSKLQTAICLNFAVSSDFIRWCHASSTWRML